MKNKQNNEIFLDIITDVTPVPNLLLEYYRGFNLSATETLFLIDLLRYKGAGIDLSIKDIACHSCYTQEEISQILAVLVERGFLAVNNKGIIDLRAFFEKMREAWGWKEAKNRSLELEKSIISSVDSEFSAIYLKFQEEMGRPLSSIEGEQIKDWFTNLSMSGEMIYEALKKAVLLDKRNFQYINKILLDWQSKGYKTPKDIASGEVKHKEKKQIKSAAKKYRDDQKGDIFDDIFEVN